MHLYNIGVAIGTPGISKDDIQHTEFTVYGMTMDDLNGQECGVCWSDKCWLWWVSGDRAVKCLTILHAATTSWANGKTISSLFVI